MLTSVRSALRLELKSNAWTSSMNIGVGVVASPCPDSSPGDQAPSEDLVFINYTHPSHLRDKKKRKQVASFVTLTQKRRERQVKPRRRSSIAEKQLNTASSDDSKANDDTETKKPDVNNAELLLEKWEPKRLQLERRGGPRTDPFRAYPVKPEGCVPWAVDFCKEARSVHDSEHRRLQNVLTLKGE